jgi:hypothetical protein
VLIGSSLACLKRGTCVAEAATSWHRPPARSTLPPSSCLPSHADALTTKHKRNYHRTLKGLFGLDDDWWPRRALFCIALHYTPTWHCLLPPARRQIRCAAACLLPCAVCRG